MTWLRRRRVARRLTALEQIDADNARAIELIDGIVRKQVLAEREAARLLSREHHPSQHERRPYVAPHVVDLGPLDGTRAIG